ncbi:MAG: HAMP domain-containing sensor histidine kinase, partial [Pygmaiobacter sp.]
LELTNMDALDCKETIALNVMLNEILEELSGIAEEKNLSVTLAGQGICIAGNRSLLYRALYNLLENAIHYNVVGGSVTISLSAVGDKTVIAISDTGSGIPPEAKDLIFEPFYRVDKSRSRQMGGAGLGLATAKSIAEKHGGTLCVTDNLPRGTIFTLTL